MGTRSLVPRRVGRVVLLLALVSVGDWIVLDLTEPSFERSRAVLRHPTTPLGVTGLSFPPDNPVRFPQLLSETGLLRDTASLQWTDGMLAYDVLSPAWVDGAVAQRRIALPVGQRLRPHAEGGWSFPPATVLGLLEQGAVASSSSRPLVDPADSLANLDERARSYLATNCSNCHRSGGPAGVLDLRHELPPSDTKHRMPPVGTVTPDPLAAWLVGEWIDAQ